MEQRENAQAAANTTDASPTREQDAFRRFMTGFSDFKELDLTDIEPLLPPTYRASRYKAK